MYRQSYRTIWFSYCQSDVSRPWTILVVQNLEGDPSSTSFLAINLFHLHTRTLTFVVAVLTLSRLGVAGTATLCAAGVSTWEFHVRAQIEEDSDKFTTLATAQSSAVFERKGWRLYWGCFHQEKWQSVTYNAGILCPKCHTAKNLCHCTKRLPELKRLAWHQMSPFRSTCITKTAFVMTQRDNGTAEIWLINR